MGRKCLTPCTHGFLKKRDCPACEKERQKKCYRSSLARGHYRGGQTYKEHLEESAIRGHNLRARKAGVPGILTLELYRFLKSQPCTYCKGTQFPIEIDHRIPMTKGGDNTISNLQSVCRYCNRSKNTFSESEFLEWLSFVRSSSSQAA